MERFKRNERIAALVKILSDNPNRLYSLNYFTECLNAAKSTISEDIVIARNVFEELGLGRIETVSGAAGGVKYRSKISAADSMDFLNRVAVLLSDPGRIITGGFLYMADVISNPQVAYSAGRVLAGCFERAPVSYVVTVETKGIPIALMTAQAMGVPLVIARRDNRVTEGSAVNINFLSGSTGRIQTMSLSKRAMERGAGVLIIDDFMKAGGTARGMVDLMNEFDAKVAGIGVMITTTKPEEKLVSNYIPLMYLEGVDEKSRKVSIKPNEKLPF
ncbi:MAG: pur operon repressor [Bacillota bacterium]|nr:pur operon repressor [Bacillota bacterium]MDD3297724.1 pur operon repressor [Bacillota bacterium]MDD3850309.1 pur operon repressor [Bacillota bacterium]MDD4707598.1 pur operon repressor [Bacillota bacterium]